MDKLKIEIENKYINDVKLKISKINNINIKKDKLDELSLNIKKLSYIINLINYSINNNIFKKDKFINLLKNDIYKTTNINLDKKNIFNLLKKSIENKNSFKKINKLNRNKINIKGGSMNDMFIWDKNTRQSTKILDLTSFFLDILGLVPMYGIIFDGSNVILNLLRGDILNAAFSLIGLVPVIGVIGPSLKLGYKLSKKNKNLNNNSSETQRSETDSSETDNSETDSSETDSETESSDSSN
jgi:hypothetical protein